MVHTAENLAFAALVFGALLLPMQGLRAGWTGGISVNAPTDRVAGILLSDAALLLAWVAGTIAVVGQRDRVRIPRSVGWSLVALAIGGGVGLVSAHARGDSAALLLRFAGIVVVCFVAVWAARPSGRRGFAVVGAYLIGSTMSALVGLIAVGASGGSSFESGLGRAVGLAANAGALSVVSLIGVVLAVVLVGEARTPGVRALLVVSIVVQAAAIIYSGTRGATLAAAMIGVLVWTRALRRGNRAGAVAAVAVVGSIMLLALVGPIRLPAVDRLIGRTDTVVSSAVDRSTELRAAQYRKQLEARGWHSLLVGSGLEDLEPTPASQQQDDLRDPHNTYFEVWLGLGLIGLGGWTAALVVTVVPGLRLFWEGRPLTGDLLLLAALSLAILAFSVAAFTLNNVWNRYLWLFVAWAAWLQARQLESRP